MIVFKFMIASKVFSDSNNKGYKKKEKKNSPEYFCIRIQVARKRGEK